MRVVDPHRSHPDRDGFLHRDLVFQCDPVV